MQWRVSGDLAVRVPFVREVEAPDSELAERDATTEVRQHKVHDLDGNRVQGTVEIDYVEEVEDGG